MPCRETEAVVAMTAGNLWKNLPAELPQELSTDILRAGDVRVERIVSRGHSSPPGFWCDQDEHEWVLLLTGHARLEFADQSTLIELRPGDFINLPAHAKHRVAWTDPDQDSVWLVIFYRD